MPKMKTHSGARSASEDGLGKSLRERRRTTSACSSKVSRRKRRLNLTKPLSKTDREDRQAPARPALN